MNLSIDKKTQLLRDCWMRHDAMWFKNTMPLCEFKALNKINKETVYRLAQFEMFSLIRSMENYKHPDNKSDLLNVLKFAVDIYQTNRSKVDIKQTDENKLNIKMHDCWACKSVENAGLLKDYECGPWQRLKGWLKALDIESEMKPDPVACLKHIGVHDGSVCEIDLEILSFNENQISNKLL